MTITYHIFNSIDSKNIMTISMPWEYRKAIKGFYSNLWRDFKTSCASSQKLDKLFVKAKIIRNKVQTDRLEISYPSGLKLNAPFELSVIDFKIINLHLEAAQLACPATLE